MTTMNLDINVDNYTLTESAKELVKKARIVLLAGIAGAGKDTLKRELLKNSTFRDIVSHTTRQPRHNNGIFEEDGKDYHFISLTQAAEMINRQEFVEVKYVHGDTIYGTSVAEIEAGITERRISITDVDIQGVAEYKKISPEVVAIFILPPSYEVWRDRLMKRYESQEAFDAEWPKRRASALKELSHALEVPYYHFIINDDLDRTIKIANDIAQKTDVFHRKDDEARLAARDILDELTANN
jgi:guanylate kinase